jgi:hypothetical protein
MRSLMHFANGEDRMPHSYSNQIFLLLKSAKRGHASSTESFAQPFFKDFLRSQTREKLSFGEPYWILNALTFKQTRPFFLPRT